MTAEQQLSFAEHVRELRGRLVWTVFFVLIGAGVGYFLHDRLLRVLQKPLHDTLYYNNPTGAFSFIIKICVTFGLVIALPMIIYQIFAFFGPLIKAKTRRQFVGYVVASFVLASTGIAFAYWISLPAALHFLVNFGADKGDIQALITADEYFNFVLTYIAGFAILFQLPLIIAFINRVKPLDPKILMKQTRIVILVSFVVAAIITPTPDPFNQFIMAGPIIILYFASVCMVAVINIRKTSKNRKKGELTPIIESKTIDAILASLPTQPKPISAIKVKPLPESKFAKALDLTPQTKAAAVNAMRGVSAPQVIKKPARPIASSTSRQVKREIKIPATNRAPNFRPSPRLISDFVIATE